MGRIIPRLLAVAVLAGAVVSIACDSESDVNSDQAQQQVKEVSQNVKQEVRQAWAGFQTDSERLVDDVQTRKDPEAKKKLVDSCRDTLERLRREDADSASRIEKICDKIRDTDVNNNSAWNDVKS